MTTSESKGRFFNDEHSDGGGLFEEQRSARITRRRHNRNRIGEYLAKLQARTWLSRVLERLANTLLKDRESARNNHVLAYNCAKYWPILNIFHSQTQQ